jgi:hypothetical protein
MGLEAVEIVMESERVFDIRILDSEVRNAATPRSLLDVILAKLALRPSRRCSTQQAYYRLARALVRLIGSGDVGLETELAGLVTATEWPGWWRAIRALEGDSSWPAQVPWPGRFFKRDSAPRTVRDLVLFVANDAATRLPNTDGWTRQDAELAVRRIIADELGLGTGFNLDASFRSLGIV